jgi:aconitate hydratase 2/2-methylisocitrate dehydratase
VLEAYRAHVAERAALGIPPLPLSKQQTTELVGLLKNPPAGEEAALVELMTYRVPAGVDDAAKVKAEFLAKVAKGEEACALISKEKATELLGTMLGGYNVKPLIDLLANAPKLRRCCCRRPEEDPAGVRLLPRCRRTGQGRQCQRQGRHAVLGRRRVVHLASGSPASQKLTVFKVTGETNTDDLSPAPDAWSRPDIPLHALAMLKNPRPGIEADEPGRAVR